MSVFRSAADYQFDTPPDHEYYSPREMIMGQLILILALLLGVLLQAFS